MMTEEQQGRIYIDDSIKKYLEMSQGTLCFAVPKWLSYSELKPLEKYIYIDIIDIYKRDQAMLKKGLADYRPFVMTAKNYLRHYNKLYKKNISLVTVQRALNGLKKKGYLNYADRGELVTNPDGKKENKPVNYTVLVPESMQQVAEEIRKAATALLYEECSIEFADRQKRAQLARLDEIAAIVKAAWSEAQTQELEALAEKYFSIEKRRGENLQEILIKAQIKGLKERALTMSDKDMERELFGG